MNTYEAMFLFDPAAGSNWEAAQAEIDRLMTRAEAEVIVTRRLEERRLAYEIDGRKRGFYVLTYFRANGAKIGPLERDIRLSEPILRALILRADDVSEETMNTVTLGGMAVDKPPTEESASPAPGASAGAGPAEPTPAEEPAGDTGAEGASDDAADSKPELVASSAEPNEKKEADV